MDKADAGSQYVLLEDDSEETFTIKQPDGRSGGASSSGVSSYNPVSRGEEAQI